MPLLPSTIRVATSRVQPQVEGRRSAWREAWRSAALAGRRQKYSSNAAPPVANSAMRICASAPGWPSDAATELASGAPAPACAFA